MGVGSLEAARIPDGKVDFDRAWRKLIILWSAISIVAISFFGPDKRLGVTGREAPFTRRCRRSRPVRDDDTRECMCAFLPPGA